MAKHREFICITCGEKNVDTSPKQDRKFCSRKCLYKYHNSNRPKPVETECLYNDGVECTKPKCACCGWNPAVEEMRKERRKKSWEKRMITVLQVDAPLHMAQSIKEHIAMQLEKFGDTKVLEIRAEETAKQEEMSI